MKVSLVSIFIDSKLLGKGHHLARLLGGGLEFNSIKKNSSMLLRSTK